MSPFDTLAVASGAETRPAALIDPFGRSIDYVRVSVTDRCDMRCVYCMSKQQTFLPRAEVLSLEELDRLCSAFVSLGTRRLRLTGGEPLVRKGFMDLVQGLSRHLRSGALDELTLTTNGTRLAEHAEGLAKAGVRRVNVSIDSRSTGSRAAGIWDGCLRASRRRRPQASRSRSTPWRSSRTTPMTCPP